MSQSSGRSFQDAPPAYQERGASARHRDLPGFIPPPQPPVFPPFLQQWLALSLRSLSYLLSPILCILLWLAVFWTIWRVAFGSGKLVFQYTLKEVNHLGCQHLPRLAIDALALDCTSDLPDAFESASSSGIWPPSTPGQLGYSLATQTAPSNPVTADVQRALDRAVASDPLSREIALIAELTEHLFSRLHSSGSKDLKDQAAVIEDVDQTMRLIGRTVNDALFGLHTIIASIRVTSSLAMEELYTVSSSHSIRTCRAIGIPGLSLLVAGLQELGERLERLRLELDRTLLALHSQDGPMRQVQLSLAEHEESLRSVLFGELGRVWNNVRFRTGFGTAQVTSAIHGIERVIHMQQVFADTRSSVSVVKLDLEAISGRLREITQHIGRDDHDGLSLTATLRSVSRNGFPSFSARDHRDEAAPKKMFLESYVEHFISLRSEPKGTPCRAAVTETPENGTAQSNMPGTDSPTNLQVAFAAVTHRLPRALIAGSRRMLHALAQTFGPSPFSVVTLRLEGQATNDRPRVQTSFNPAMGLDSAAEGLTRMERERRANEEANDLAASDALRRSQGAAEARLRHGGPVQRQEAECKRATKELERKVLQADNERDDALERAEKAESRCEDDRDLGDELREVNAHLDQVCAELRSAKMQIKLQEYGVLLTKDTIDDQEKQLEGRM
ncbi:hypothetical protein K523DRAFT_400907 [Schizophyllum commune Tattone D]|nr:hypothetical protein K523DRAFT_400907 [Schizophyllum commune Tattone D]